MEEELKMLEEVYQSHKIVGHLQKQNMALYVHQSKIYEIFKSNVLRQYFLAIVYGKEELIDSDIQIEFLP